MENQNVQECEVSDLFGGTHGTRGTRGTCVIRCIRGTRCIGGFPPLRPLPDFWC